MKPIPLPMTELKPALVGLGKIISKRTTLPVLGCVRVERTKDGWIALTATDLDNFATVRLEQPADGEAVSCLVPYEELTKTAKACGKEESILIEPKGENMVVLSYPVGSQLVETKIDSLPVEEFPPIPKIKGEPIAFPDALRQSIGEALGCASEDETRLILNGAFVDVSDAKCHAIVGTDGRHLYSANSFTLPLQSSVIIPAHRFLEWREFGRDGEWQLRLGEKSQKDDTPLVQLSSRRWRFIARQHEGHYPNWRQVIPRKDQFATTVEFLAGDANALVQLINRLPDHDAINHTIGVEVTGRTVKLLVKTQSDQPVTKVPAPTGRVNGKEVTVFLNRHYLTKALNFGLCRLEIIDSLSPLKLSNDGRTMIVMPVRADSGPPRPPTTPAEQTPQEPAAPAPSSADLAQPEERRTPMPRTTTNTTNGNGHASNGEHAEKPAIETALEKIETIKGSYREAIKGLNDLTDTLKQVQREHKAIEKEVQSVRSTLEKLQSVRI